MKPHATLIIALLAAAPLSALRADDKNETTASAVGIATGTTTAAAEKNAKAGRRDEESKPKKPQGDRRPGPPAQHPQQELAPYIGVMTRDVSPELRSQFSLRPGFGILVEGVMPDSPAEKAGLKQHDLKFDDQHLVSMEQLVVLVRDRKKGDIVNLTVITGGKETRVPVTLGEHLMPTMTSRHPSMSGSPQNPGIFIHPGMPQGFPQNQMQDLKEHMNRFQKEMRDYQQRVQEWAKDGSKGPMPQPPVFQQPPSARPGHNHAKDTSASAAAAPPAITFTAPAHVHQFNVSEAHAASSVTRRDDTGEYTLKRDDGKATFTARPKNGTEQSWPVNSDAERAAIPAEFREKLRLMDGPGSGVKIEIRPATPQSDNAPAAPPGGDGNDASAKSGAATVSGDTI